MLYHYQGEKIVFESFHNDFCLRVLLGTRKNERKSPGNADPRTGPRTPPPPQRYPKPGALAPRLREPDVERVTKESLAPKGTIKTLHA